jgi:arylsulfatase A-like enzyme
MKAIMVMFDSLNRHVLPPYGDSWVHAPNFTRLAQRSLTFDRCYVGSMPCIPARRELHTGRYNFLHRSWGPLEPFDDSLPQILQQHGVYTHLVSDHGHYWEDGGATYHTRYNTWEYARGQEGDPWKGHVADPEIPDNIRLFKNEHWRQDWVNRTYMQDEADWSQTQTFANGLEFIRTNHTQDRWFLQIEAFDPHEPFFAPSRFRDMYPDEYDGPHFDWPDYNRVTESDEQVDHVRREYGALVSMCDQSLGKVLDVMDELDLWPDTLLIVCTDHGYLLGEHDWWGKNRMPWYNEIAHIPLFIWDPRHRHQNERRQSLVQWIDFAPTVLDYFGIAPTPDMQGHALAQTIADDTPVREAALFGIHGGHVSITDGRYVYMRAPVSPSNQPLYEYTLMPTRMRGFVGHEELSQIQLADPFAFTKGLRTLKMPARSWVNAHHFGTLLYNLQTDPGQRQPIVDETVERRLIAWMVGLMQVSDAPVEQYERLGLPQDGIVQYEHLRLQADYERAVALHQEFRFEEAIIPASSLFDVPLKDLLADDAARSVLSEFLPSFLLNPPVPMLAHVPLRGLVGLAPGILTAETVAAIAVEFARRDVNAAN